MLHDGLALIAEQHKGSGGVDIDAIASAATKAILNLFIPVKENQLYSNDEENFAYEQAALIEGLLRGFYLHVWPRLLADFPRIVAVEQEVTYREDDYVFQARPDLILANDAGEWTYIEYKSTSSKRDSWTNSWSTAVQAHTGIKAVKQTMGTAPEHVQVVGLYKGYEAYGRQQSPFCYCYKKPGNPPFSRDMIRYEYSAGFRAAPAWELPGGVKAWVAGMPEDMLAEQFPMTPPIFINEPLVDAFIRQRKARGHAIKHNLKAVADGGIDERDMLDYLFPQSFAECTPSFGSPCVYRLMCHSYVDNPFQHGYEPRVPNHPIPQEQT